MIDTFTREQFESALPLNKTTKQPSWHPAGEVDGEYVYQIPIHNPHIPPFPRPQLYIIVRSSVRPNGVSAGSGEDSIRCWVEMNGKPQAYKLGKYVTRVPGWEKRLTDTLRRLYKIGMMLVPCVNCGELMKARRVKKAGPNHGRTFQKCTGLSCGFGFLWMDEVDGQLVVKEREN